MCVTCWVTNVVAFNDEDIETAVWPGLRGDDSSDFTRRHLGQLEGGGRHRPNLHSFPCLVGDATCPPSTQLEPSAEAPHKASCRAVRSS